VSLLERILNCFPTGHYAITAFLRVVDIVESRDVPTAAIENKISPRMLINPDFVEQHAETPEKLLMLVMHELHHMMLGHTVSHPRITPFDNFVFDAVINGVLCQMFPTPAFTSLLTDYYSESFPECLLRPPPGWPEQGGVALGITALRDPRQVKAAAAAHRGLYSEAGYSYAELYVLLSSFGLGSAPVAGRLLGDHASETELVLENSLAEIAADFGSTFAEEFPHIWTDEVHMGYAGRGAAMAPVERIVKPRTNHRNRAALRRLLSRIARGGRGGTQRIMDWTARPVEQAMPTMDRRASVQRLLGHQPLLHWDERVARRANCPGERVHVYFDVSGSVWHLLEELYGALLDVEADVHPVVHLFSTQVYDMPIERFRRGAMRTSLGTEITCVARHMAKFDVRRALIVTDGFTDSPSGRDLAVMRRATLGVAVIKGEQCQRDLEKVVDFWGFLEVDPPVAASA